MLKRRLFFLLENLKINPAERRSISVLIAVFLVSGFVNWNLTPHSAFDKKNYTRLVRAFKERKMELKKEKTKLMARYHPEHSHGASPDTVLNDSLNEKTKEIPGTQESGSDSKINVNKADIPALKTLPGIGPVYARRIVKFRNEHGSFISYNDLLKIKGIGKKRLEKLKTFIKL